MVIAMMGLHDVYVKYYEGIPEASGVLFNKSSAYRFFRILYRNTLNRIRRTGIYKPEEKTRSATLKGIPETSLGDDISYLKSGMRYRYRRELTLAEEAFKKAITLNPRNDTAYVRLGWLYCDQEKLPEAEKAFKKAIELSPKKDEAYIQLGKFYRDYFRKPVRAEAAFKRAIELNPKNDEAYVELGLCFTYYGKLTLAEEAFKKAIVLSPTGHKAYRGFALLYSQMGQAKLADEYYGIAKQLKYGYYGLLTNRNYQKLKMVLDKRGIKLICVQYPVRSVEPLKRIFQGQQGVIFVDNEAVFKEALAKASYQDYFTDMFGGDFGHCTRKGNRLLAENIANVILEEYFGDN